MKKNDPIYNYNVPLQEMKRLYTVQMDGLDAIKTTVRTVFSAASLIVSILGALQIYTAKVDPAWQVGYWVLLGCIALLYVAFIVVCMAGMMPVYVYPPLDDDWDTLTKTFQNMTEQEENAMYLSALLQAIRMNRPIIAKFKKIETAALIMLPVVVVLTLSLAFIPRV